MRIRTMAGRRRWAAVAAVLAMVVAGLGTASASADPLAATAATPGGAALATAGLGAEETALVRVQLPNAAMLDQLVAAGADIATTARAEQGRVLVDLVLTGRDLAALVARGAVLRQVVQRAGDGRARYAASVRAAAQRTKTGLQPKAGTGSIAEAPTTIDTVRFLQAYWWLSQGRTFLQAEVTTTATEDPNVEITVTWRAADGTTGSFPLERFEDAGVYMYHVALPQPLPAQPVEVTATSSLGGSTTTTPAPWPNSTPPPPPQGYQKDF